MRFFEISYIPKGQKAFKMVGDILSDTGLVSEINEDVDEHGHFLANLEVVESLSAKERNYDTKATGHKKKFLGKEPVNADFNIKVVSGEKHDSIVVSGDSEYKDVAALVAKHIRAKVLPNVNIQDQVIVVKSY